MLSLVISLYPTLSINLQSIAYKSYVGPEVLYQSEILCFQVERKTENQAKSNMWSKEEDWKINQDLIELLLLNEA